MSDENKPTRDDHLEFCRTRILALELENKKLNASLNLKFAGPTPTIESYCKHLQAKVEQLEEQVKTLACEKAVLTAKLDDSKSGFDAAALKSRISELEMQIEKLEKEIKDLKDKEITLSKVNAETQNSLIRQLDAARHEKWLETNERDAAMKAMDTARDELKDLKQLLTGTQEVSVLSADFTSHKVTIELPSSFWPVKLPCNLTELLKIPTPGEQNSYQTSNKS